ncbi:MAG: DUF4249 family protein, partial [Bizionia sp.]|nr:DUF4249 family protein [Bizionia sp.]
MKDFYNILTLIVLLISFSCTEEIPLETIGFNDVLVVEATITNEFKHQEIKISRTYLLEESNQRIEENANVSIIDSQGNTYHFSQNNEGTYVSDIEFEALLNINYTLLVTTSDGKNYNSSETKLSPLSQIDDLYAEIALEGAQANKVHVLLNSNNEGS